jgi:hypothetical protein
VTRKQVTMRLAVDPIDEIAAAIAKETGQRPDRTQVVRALLGAAYNTPGAKDAALRTLRQWAAQQGV